MGNKYIKNASFALAMLILFFEVGAARAQYYSTNYAANEVFFGVGGTGYNNESSTHYESQVTIGDTGVGNSKGTAYQAEGGFNTSTDPFLEFVVNPASIDLGVLTTATAGTATDTFLVEDYLSTGYVIFNDATAPSDGSHTMTNLTSPTGSIPGTEQFGINLVANTSPVTFGAAPVQQPDSTFSYGQVSAGYGTANQFKYVSGQTIAYSNSSSGETDYTMSFLYNISSATPTGLYTFNDKLIALAIY
jgi:hypothetical protein